MRSAKASLGWVLLASLAAACSDAKPVATPQPVDERVAQVDVDTDSPDASARVADAAPTAEPPPTDEGVSAWPRLGAFDDPPLVSQETDASPSPVGVGAGLNPKIEVARPAATLEPLETKPLVSIEVAGFEKAVVAVPQGITARAPLVIAMHGSFDKPESMCSTYARVFQDKAFVLCPRGMLAPGSPWGDKRFTFVEAHLAERELDASLDALERSELARYIDQKRPVYVGFSLGAIVGVPLARKRARDFSSMVFVEGSLDPFSRSMLQDFVESGGHHIMLVCSDGKESLGLCSSHARNIVQKLEALGGDGVVVDAGRAGHTFEGKVAKAVAHEMPAFVGNDPRFATMTEAPTIDFPSGY